MKRILFLMMIVLAFTDMVKAQNVLPNNSPGEIGKYLLVTKAHVKNDLAVCSDCDDNYWTLNYSLQNGGEILVYRGCVDENSDETKGPHNISFLTSNLITQIRTHAKRKTKYGLFCNETHEVDYVQSLDYNTLTGCNYFNDAFILNDDYVVQNSTKEIIIKPDFDTAVLLRLNNQFAELPTVTKITFKAPSGFPSGVYHWQYNLSAINPVWVDFPATFQGDSVVSFSATDLLSASTNSNINKQINIRIKACGPPTTNNETLSDNFQLPIYKDAPHITSTTTQQTSCFDALDGRATVHFDRNLVANEKLNIIFNKLDTVTNTSTTAWTAANLTTLPGSAYQTPAILSPGKYVVKLIGTYFANGQNSATFTEDPLTHYDTFYISKPLAVAFSKTKVDVWCYNGMDGQIDVSATGGIGGFKYHLFSASNNDTAWYPFNAGAQQHITSLVQGTYFVKVRDANGCVAKNNGGIGTEITDTTTINQPADSIHIDLVANQEPTAFGFSDGFIHVAVYGGTISPSGTYSYTWTDSSNTVQTTDSAYTVAGVYHIWLKNIGAGVYNINIKDHQYTNASDKDGCEKAASYTILQPQPLMVQLEVTKLPSCNKTNTYLDPYSDGIITAHATGGTPFSTPALPYQYTWKKKDAGNNWVVMTGYTDSIAEGLEKGFYAVNVMDAHGIQLGVYQNNTLVQLTDSTIYLPDHPLLTINESISPVGCNASITGGIVSNVMGGLPPYRYNWSNGDTTMNLSAIAAGGYFLYVTDTNGCRVSKAMNVPEPDGYTLAIDTVPPTCHDGCDGTITLNLTGGTLPYSFVWQQTAANTNAVTNLCSGTYSVAISDANNCSFQRTISLSNPPLITVNMPRDTTLCNGQQTTLDISISDPATVYNWQSDNGFTASTAQVTLVNAGNYFAKITDSKGCMGIDTFTLKRLQLDIDAEILLPTHATVGEEIVLVNISNPRAEIVEWQLPPQATTIQSADNFIRFKVNDTGTYAVTLLTGVNACREKMTKDVIVTIASYVPGVNNSLPPFIEDLKILPNPNDGHFTVVLTLRETASADLKIINVLSSKIVAEREISGQEVYQEVFDLSAMAAGTYLLSAETRQERRTIKIIVQ